MKKKVIVAIVTTLLCIPVFMDTPFAEAHGPNNIIYTPYGTCTSEFYYDASNDTHDITLGGVTIPQKGPVNLIRYTFTHPYTGTFDLDITISGVLSNIWNLMTSNCYLMSVVDETTLRFAVNNAEYCEIAIMPSQYNNKLVFSLENQNLTPVEDTTTAVNSILSHVTYIDGQIQQIQANTLAVRNVLMSMSGYTADSNDNIATDMDTLISAMNTANNLLSNLVNNSIPEHAYTYDLIIKSNTHYSKVSNYLFNYYYYDVTKNHGAYNSDNSMSTNSNSDYVYIFMSNTDLQSYIYFNGNNNGVTKTMVNTYNIGGYYFYVVRIQNTLSGNFKQYSLEFNKSFYMIPIYYGSYNNVPLQVQQMANYYIGDAYTRAINAVESAVRNMAVNVNNLTVNATGITYNVNNTQVDNSVTTYNTNINQVYNIENNISNDFNTYNNQFNPDFSSSLTALQDTSTMMNGIITQINGIQLFTVPILLTLAGIVLLAILG